MGISTLFGMAHEGALTAAGRPKTMHAMVILSAYLDDTLFTNPPPSVAVPVAKLLAPIGRMMGLRASYEKYSDEAFWRAHVEQPDTPRTAST